MNGERSDEDHFKIAFQRRLHINVFDAVALDDASRGSE